MAYSHPPEIKAQAMKMYEEGMSQRSIARALGIYQSSISLWVNPEALKRRQESDRARNASPYQKSKREQRWRTEAYRSWRRGRHAARYASDPGYRALRLLRGRVQNALNGSTKSISTEELLGICVDDLISKWNVQYGADWPQRGFHIDHVRPCASFDLTDPDQQAICFNWRNLQLLPAKENIAKADIWTEDMEKDWVDRMRLMGLECELFKRYS